LALQGGGVNGAFTWGVLDRLLERDIFDIEGVVGTSAGAVNAVLLAHGLHQQSPDTARTALAAFWQGIISLGQKNPLRELNKLLNLNPFMNQILTAQRDITMSFLSMFSPYQLNPFNMNPMRDLLLQTVDFNALQSQQNIKLFLNATDVETGESRIFNEAEATVDVVMASACLPQISQAVKIDGRYYWDGGLSENPPIFPLIYGCETPDTLLVLITPRTGKGEPRDMDRILSRLNQITFNATLRNEMRQIRLLEHLHKIGELKIGTLERAHLHLIDAEASIEDKGWQSMVTIDERVITKLFEQGRAASDHFLDLHLDDIGHRSSIAWG
jgi:NTE family protein